MGVAQANESCRQRSRLPWLAHATYTEWRIAMLSLTRLLATFLAFTTATFPQAWNREPSLPPGIVKHADIAYATVGDRALVLDVYTPEARGAAPIPAVLWIHGGAWRKGSKNHPGRAMQLLERGYGLVSVGYRLSGEAIFPAAIADVKAALRWTRANAASYGFDPNRIGAWGASAGGHLAALLGTAHEVAAWDRLHAENAAVSSRPDAVCNWYGPSDFLRMNDFPGTIDHDAPDSPESQFIGAPIQRNPEKAQRANPMRYATPDDPPMLHMHGENDRLVPYNQSELLHAALEEAGVDSTLYRVAGGDHGFGAMERDTPQSLFERVAGFFERTLGAP